MVCIAQFFEELFDAIWPAAACILLLVNTDTPAVKPANADTLAVMSESQPAGAANDWISNANQPKTHGK
jgi:hypothetical protein